MATSTVLGARTSAAPASPALPASTGPAGTGRAASIPVALTPGDAQAVFRATLDALARPGTVRRLPLGGSESLAARVPGALLPLLALADLSTPACVVGDGTNQGDAGPGRAGPDRAEGRTAWDEIVRVATNAPRAVLSDARLVAALRPLTADELGSLRTGTAAAPEDGALACLAVAGIAIVEGAEPAGEAGEACAVSGEGGSTRLLLRVSGPGVPGTRAIIVTGLPAGFAAARTGLVSGFPAGTDLLLIAPDGAMTGLPRTTALREEASR